MESSGQQKSSMEYAYSGMWFETYEAFNSQYIHVTHGKFYLMIYDVTVHHADLKLSIVYLYTLMCHSTIKLLHAHSLE